MEKYVFALIALMNVFLVFILALLVFVVYRIYKQNLGLKNPPSGTEDSNPGYHPDIIDRLKQLEQVTPHRSELFCPNHLEEPGETICAVCDHLYCKACIKPYKTFYLCKEHLPLVMRNEWQEVLTIKTSTTDPERGVRLHDIKKDLFLKDDIPTYIETHYKINVDQDYIETYLVLYSIKDENDKIKQKLSVLGLTD